MNLLLRMKTGKLAPGVLYSSIKERHVSFIYSFKVIFTVARRKVKKVKDIDL